MDRELILLKGNGTKATLNQSNKSGFLLDLNKVSGQTQIIIENNNNVDLLVLNPNKSIDINFDVEDNASLHVAFLANQTVEGIKITANIGQNGQINAYFADFISGKCKGNICVNLNKEGATCDWHLASLAESKDNKEFEVNVYHNYPNTYAHLDNYGVCRDESKLVFSGICQIIKGSHGSKAHQNAKIMVFDPLSNGVAKPILKIDENDIEASHAAIVGKINDEHIFYLTSRGLSEEEAKRLITLGYLKPILIGFSDEDIKETIEKIIEGKM